MYLAEEPIKENHPAGNWISVLIKLAVLGLGIMLVGIGFFVYPDIFRTEVIFSQTNDVSIHETLVLGFSRPMIPSSVEKKISFNFPGEVFFQWSKGNRELKISPQRYWKPETEYQISLEGGRNILGVKSQDQLSFKTASYPKVESFYPASGEKNVVLDIEDPIVFNFDQSVEDFKVKFVVTPVIDLVHEIGPDKKTIKLIPKTEPAKGQRFDVRVLIKIQEESDNQYQETLATYFETKPLPPVTWSADFASRLDQARQYTEARIAEGKYIDINLKMQVMTIFENGNLLDAFMISSGKRGMETPQGSFQIRNKFPRAWSKKYGLYMPYWMAIVPSGDFGIHELPEWPSGYKEGQNHLGIPVSHGCVRLGVGPAERVYGWAEIGTPVITHY